ncbi:integral membrane protein-like protein [Dothidotthia symphoricarpi CBS 119687]|uniref:Integral membrane protein-like protein n=1 Tax=Dothidotthia symphoricarpi CBS 119687 TaxID=1392245 RepID=A0A6A6AM99_9PLEO|nr:integral membrane protein-like protein [Dothidotthia symphoricarpi CBS 119687]KAF2132215.1 integral membrane protein-like protein [Dothidotthia symphoricarpi CBS 119687]
MVLTQPLDEDSVSYVLPAHIHPWLQAVVTLAFISFFASVSLLFLLTYKLISWQIKSKKSNQFVILIFNLLWADIHQALAFLLNVEWLRLGSVVVENPICFAQGWLVSTGDLGSGVWCFAIGLHTFASVILEFRLSPRYFYASVIALWVFILGVSSIGVGMYGTDLYVRSGVWCWIHHDLKDLRLWTHYVWIFIFEFGNAIIYAIIYAILLHRIRTGYYTPVEARRVKSISNLMVVYPLVYVICTIPLASARMAAMTGHPPSLARLCLAGAMITSNGWLDVLLYTVTRRIMIFSDEAPPDDNGFDTFTTFWADGPRRFGGECTVEAGKPKGRSKVTLPSSNESSDDLCGIGMGSKDIKLVTTTKVISEPALPEDYEEMVSGNMNPRPRSPLGRWSDESDRSKEFVLAQMPI